MKRSFTVCLLLIMGLSLPGGCRKQAPPPANAATPVIVYDVQPVTIRDQLILSGTAMPWQSVTLSAEIGGTIVEVARRPTPEGTTREFREGDRVARGEMLYGIDTRTLEAELRSAQAAAEYARKTAERYASLRDRGAASEDEFQRYRSQAEQSEEAVKAAQSRLDKARVRSPIDGIVQSKEADLAENITSGARLCQIVSIEKLKVLIAIPENVVRYIQMGDEMELSFEALPEGQTVTGRVIYIAPLADPQTLTFPVHLEVDNSDGRLRAGNIAKVLLVKRAAETIAVPIPALMTGVSGYHVMVVVDGKARSRMVELGVMDGPFFEIRSGLQVGDRLIVMGQREAVEGQPVDVVATASLQQLQQPTALAEMLLRAKNDQKSPNQVGQTVVPESKTAEPAAAAPADASAAGGSSASAEPSATQTPAADPAAAQADGTGSQTE